MTALLALVKVQIQLYLRNRRAMLINVLVPILIASFFGSLFGGSGSKEAALALPVALVDEDGGELSQRIVRLLAADPVLKAQPLTREQAEPLVRQGKLKAALVFNKGFGDQASQALFGGDKAHAEVLYDPSDNLALGLLRGLLAQYTMQQVMSSSFTGATGQKNLDATLARVENSKDLAPDQRETLKNMFASVRKLQNDFPSAASAASATFATSAASAPEGKNPLLSPPYVLEERGLASGTQGYNGYAHSFAGMGAQFVLFMGVELGVAILLARRSGLWARLRAAPLSRLSLLASHLVSTTLIASCVMAVIMGAGMLIFGFRPSGSVLGLALVILGYGFFTGGFGLFLAAIGRSPEATRGLAVMAALMMVMLGGAWVPSFIFPAWLQDLTLVVPVRWAIDGLDAMTWRGLDFGVAVTAAAVLAAFAVVFAALAWWRFDWRE
ncbi:MAG: ABC transporter permease [Paucibacter sp.]|nr:ABC transporter permease [Roseateles sp.]